jgi:hypothetical protein
MLLAVFRHSGVAIWRGRPRLNMQKKAQRLEVPELPMPQIVPSPTTFFATTNPLVEYIAPGKGADVRPFQLCYRRRFYQPGRFPSSRDRP